MDSLVPHKIRSLNESFLAKRTFLPHARMNQQMFLVRIAPNELLRTELTGVYHILVDQIVTAEAGFG